MTPKCDSIVMALLSPQSLCHLSALEWDLLIRQGRRANLLARLAHKLTQNGLIDAIPLAPRHHLTSALKMAQRQETALRWEVECIGQALTDAEVKVVLLKGAAYVMADLAAAHGRTFSDVDIIVPKKRLGRCESELMIHGWQGSHHDDYDQRYYRRWMHEIPPMRHVKRGTTIDVHHTILPETARVKVNTTALLTGVVALPGHTNLYVLQPTDMLLHSATHLFHEGDFEKGLRDLFDLDSLLRQFGDMHGFWEQLVPRAAVLGLTRPLYYALRYTTLMLDTPVPSHVLELARIGKPPPLVGQLMDACYLRALRPVHASTSSLGTWPARFALYVRSHWIRMPFFLLAYHLGRKAFIRPESHDLEKSIADVDLKA
ncbi:nucleotidyltransferase domain-containing protein [Rhodoferax sp. UBA5149]|uniref:nucleotidyltransferase domain-containing protein n=1 Tax=Rhodoferax sp. UBA5149 TaxID=1947379 RepID=UPI0025E095C4|nr:nucleotidyltransferase family protein [Rhodoferax sp. UBA5149]